jgi:hypothetical protein
MSDKEWDYWTDVLGQTYRVGDTVAVATVNGKSPQMVLARVERINKMDSKGKPITKSEWVWEDSFQTYNWREPHERKEFPSCTVTATPIVDARGFTRYSSQHWNSETKQIEHTQAKKINYSIPENIIKIKLSS